MQLRVEVTGRHFSVSVRSPSHEQIVDLQVLLIGSDGRSTAVPPTGSPGERATGMMRTSILLFPTGDRTIELAAGELPPDLDVSELQAVLRNPLARGEHSFASASELVRKPIEH